MALTSDEMNFLIYRYLRESGFEHSAYAFGNESYVYKSSIDGSAVPPGALISFVQKGLQYVEIEAHINDDGTETLCDESFSVLRKHTCRVKQRKRIFDPYEPMESDYGPLELDDTQLTQLKGHLDMICCCAWHPTEPILATGSGDGTVRLWVIRPIDDSASDTTTSTTTSTTSSTTTSSSSSTTTTTSTSTTTVPTLRYEAIMETSTILKPAHLDKVTTVTTMEEDDGNKDGDDDGDEGEKKKRTKNSNKRQKTSVQAATSAVIASMAPVIKHNRSIVAMDWSPLGTHIATGCYDGSVRIWTRQGTLALTLKQHQAPISSVRYHPKGDLLLTASVDQSVIVWDAASGDVRHATRIHTAPVIDIDWRNDTSYATCGVDHMIHIINVGEDIPYRSLTQHTRDVNAIRFDPSGTMLASASDDGTVKIWKFDKDTTTSNGISTNIPPGMGPSQAPLHDLKEHDREVSIVRWSPTGPGTKNPDVPLMLASASLDTTIKLWDPVEGRCLLTLAKHIHPVTSLAFSPNGQYIASGSHDRTHIWATKDGTLLKTYKTDVGGVNDLSWDSTGHELAVMFSHPTAVALHIHV